MVDFEAEAAEAVTVDEAVEVFEESEVKEEVLAAVDFEVVVVEAADLAAQEKCIKQYAPAANKNVKYLLSQRKAGQSIAGIVSSNIDPHASSRWVRN